MFTVNADASPYCDLRYYYLQHNSHDEKADEEVSAVAGLELGPSFISIDQKGGDGKLSMDFRKFHARDDPF